MSTRRSKKKRRAKRMPASRSGALADGVGKERAGEFRVSVPADLAQSWRDPVVRPHTGSLVTDGADTTAATLPATSAPTDPSATGIERYVARNAPPVVPVTFWFDPPAEEVTVRVAGRRLGVNSRPGKGDSFQHYERVTGLLVGSGPVSVTAKVRNVNPGEWAVDARAMSTTRTSTVDTLTRAPILTVHRARWSWRHWRLTEGPSEPVQTCLAPFVRPPAVLRFSWPALVLVGIVVALLVQHLVLVALDLRLSHVLTVSVPTVLAGAVGGKAWYVLLQRRAGRRQGWAVQGFVTGVILVAPPLLAALRVPVGPFLDASAPGLLFGLAVGRLGCFLTGCCAGRPTGSRWAVWSSNRRVGARRIPAQLLESALAASVGIAVLVAVLRVGPESGKWFVAAVAAYTLIRQAVLQVREERRQSRRGSALVAAAAATTLLVDLILLLGAR